MPTTSAASSIRDIPTEVLQTAIEKSRGPLILTDYRTPDNVIVYSNQAFLDLTGYAMDEIIGRNCRFLQGSDSEPAAIAELRQSVQEQRSSRVTLKNYRKDGTPFWNDLLMTPVKNAAGETTHFMGMQLDITDRVLAEQALQVRTDELQLTNHDLEQFTYATSHDLQEPLRMISSYLQLITKRHGSELDEDTKTFIGFATEGAERMQQLISDLLTLSRVASNEDHTKRVDMTDIVNRALFNLRLAIEETGAQITVEKLPKLTVEPTQLTQLFQNLISNALKYRRPDVPLEITVSAKKLADAYEFTVSDNGIGIQRQYYKRIFAVFQRLHTRSEYPGTGIGLAICMRIVERHGGTLKVASTVGAGSSFSFTIPIIPTKQTVTKPGGK